MVDEYIENSSTLERDLEFLATRVDRIDSISSDYFRVDDRRLGRFR